MIREQKNKFWLTLILILSLSFSAFALGVANVFNNRKSNPALPVDATTDGTLLTDKVGDPTDANNNGVTDENLWKKNGSTFVSDIGTIYGGTEISVETASDLNTTANDESWHSALRVRVKGTDGTTPYENTYQPYIQNGYELVGFYFYAGESKYSNKDESDTNKDLFEAGESATTEEIDPEYTGKITIKAVCEPIQYNLSLYYSEDGSTWEEKTATFNAETPLDLTTGEYDLGEIETEGKERTFSSWAILTSYVDQNNGDFIVVDNIKFGAINKDDNPAEADIFTAGDGKTYYYITSVQGYSSTKTNDWFTETKHESSFNPVIRATWSYVYNGLIDNNHIIQGAHDDEKLIGAVSSDDLNNADENHKIAKLKIAGAVYGSYKYPFMKNTGTAFYYKAEAENNKVSASKGSYYVYNYGYEIIGWEIYFQLDKKIYLVVKEDNGKTYWDVDTTIESGDNKTNSNEFLSKTNTSDLASFCERLDAYFISGYDPKTFITMKPVWQAAQIDLISDESSILSNKITYGGDYSISDSHVDCEDGQIIYAYGFTKDVPSIAKNHDNNPMPWNYVNIAQNQFDKNGNIYKFADGTYKLTVEPVCVDNIYKISLENGDIGSLGTGGVYTLAPTSNDQYKFAVGSETPVDKVYITTAILDNQYQNFNKGVYENDSIEMYISKVVSEALNEYNTKIGNGTLDILRKVFTTNNKVVLSEQNLQCTGSTNFYIYLANNKPAGDLPVFKYGHYLLISWDNIGTKAVGGGNVKRAYETYMYDEDFHKEEFDSYDCYITEEGEGHNHKADPSTCKKIRNINEKPYWVYSEMNEAMVFKAHFFRKNYLLDLNTIHQETSKEGRYGYILIDITEEDNIIKGTADDKSGKFIAVFQDGKMQYFDVTNNYENINSISGKTAFAFTKSDLLYTDAEGDYIKLYAGCKLTIISSCVDDLWENTDDKNKFPYLDMVGYYLSSVKTTTKINGSLDNSKNWFGDVAYANISNKTAGKHVITLESGDKDTQGTIEYLQCPSGSKIAINAYFAPIDYQITISLKTNDVNNPFAGRVDHNNQSTHYGEATITFNADGDYEINVEKGWSYAIEYLANAGYTLSKNAFATYEKGSAESHILQFYDSSNTNTSQSYSFALDSAWLINHYYKTTYDATPNFAQTLAFDVNTELYNFAYNVEFVDELGSVLEVRKYLDAIKLDGKTDASNIALITYGGEKFDKLSNKLIGKVFEKLNAKEDFYVVKILTCTNTEAGHTHTEYCYTNYVVLESWLPYAILGNNNYRTVYEFLLKASDLSKEDVNDVLSQSVMNNIFGFGEIVTSDDRVLTVRIKVSELYTITLKAEPHSTYPDPGYGERTTTIKNHNIGAGNYTNSGTLTTSGSNFWNDDDGKDNYVIIYSYKGVENVISSTFNEVAYKGVNYRYVGSSSKIENGKFILDETIVDGNGNVEIIVTYIPKPIETFNVTYQLNGVENSSIVAKFGSTNTTNKLIKELKSTSITGLYSGQRVDYQYELLSNDHMVIVTLNGVVQTSNPFACVVNNQTYQSGGFFIVVNLISIQKENATIMYVLDDSTKAFTDDIYGEMEVFVNTTNVTPVPINGMFVVSVAEGKKLSVDISKMAKGYSFVSLKRASTVLTTTLPANKKLTITNSFDFQENNTYFVVIKKDTIRATLTLDGVENDYVGYYNITTSSEKTNVSGNIKSVDSYLGKTLEFTKVDKEKEKLGYYYYLDKDGNEHKVEEANGKITLKLTSDILGQLVDKVDGVYNINIGVKTIKKYKLTCNVVNEIYAEPVELTVVGGDTYLNGTYMLDGTKINVNILAKDNIMNADGVTIKEAKYNIKFSGCDIVDAGGNVLTNAEKEVEFTQGIANGFVVLDDDKTLTITMTQKTYSTTNNEYIYNDIDSYNLLTPTSSIENIGSFEVDGEVNGVVKYGESVTARFNRVNKTIGELTVVRLSGNDSESLIVHIRGKQITSIYNATSNIEYVINTNKSKHSLVEGVKIEEITNFKDKLQEFGYNFTISNSDIVEISYIVKHTINIKTEYLCYKTIKPII